MKYVFILNLIFLCISCSSNQTKSSRDYLTRNTKIYHEDSSNHVRIYSKEFGKGDYLTIIPSLGRGVEDFTEQYQSTLTTRFVEAGYQVILIQPRGIGRSTGNLSGKNITMKNFVEDLKESFDALGIKKIWFVGHAFGNDLTNQFAKDYPQYVKGLALLAPGGSTLANEEARSCLYGSFNMRLPKSKRKEMIECAFFARGNDGSVWLNGWYPQLAMAQLQALKNEKIKSNNKEEREALIIQGVEDFVASPSESSGRSLASDMGDKAIYKEISDAGHALTSERPDDVAEMVINYFRNN